VVVLTPNSHEEYFQEEFEDENTFIEHLEVEQSNEYFICSRIQRFLRQLRVFVLDASGDITTIDDLYRIYRKERTSVGLHRKARNLLFDLLVFVFRRSKFLRKALIWIDGRLFIGHFHRHLFEKYRPDMLVTPSLGYFRHDEYIMREARYHNVPVVSVILSWDNTTSWGMAGAFADYVIAQTELMKEELVRLHDFDSSKIFVEGIAYFDHYFHLEALPNREAFFVKMGLDPNRRLIILATQSPNIYPWNPDLIAMVAGAIEDGRLPKDCQLLVRLHPLHLRYADGQAVYQDLLDEYEQMKDRYPFIAFNFPRALSTKLEADMPRSEMVDVACMLRYADVLVNHFSTIAVEASIFDLPTINVGFEPGPLNKRTKLKQSSELAERRTHNQRVIRTGGIRTIYSEEELIDAINRYLHDCKLDAQGRGIIRQNEIGPNRGCAGKHIGQRLLSLLDER